MTREIKVALIGAGNMGRAHAQALRAVPGVRLAGIFSRTPANARALAAELDIETVCDSIAELYERSRADAVILAVSELAAGALATQCFAHPWLVLLEKPAGYNLQDAEAILAAARRANARAYVALNRRSYQSTRRALEALGHAGSGPRLISIQDQQDVVFAASVGTPAEVVRYYMFANSIHLIDYFHVFGRGSIRAIRHFAKWNAEKPGSVIAHIEFSSGDVGIYQAIWDGPGPWAVAVTQPQLRVEMRPLEHLTLQRRGERKIVPVDLGTLDTQYKPGLYVQAEEMVNSLREGRSPRLATLAEATESMRLCASIYEMFA